MGPGTLMLSCAKVDPWVEIQLKIYDRCFLAFKDEGLDLLSFC